MSQPLILTCVFFGIALLFPFLAFLFRVKRKASESSEGHWAELKASVMFLNTALPTLLFLLGALGFGTYDTIVKKVTMQVTGEVNKTIRRETVDSLVTDTRMLHQKARADADALYDILLTLQDTVDVTIATFLNLLPRGTIIPYAGARNGYDPEYWALCDGKNGTPDLRGRFILGSPFSMLGQRGGKSKHRHKATLNVDGRVTKRKSLFFPHRDGTGPEFSVERHEHTFRITRANAGISTESHLPPYYRVAYLMKIK